MACCECCNSPGYQNFNRWVLLFLSVVAFAFSIVAVMHCSFWHLSAFGRDSPGIGIYKIEDPIDESCVSYPDGKEFTTAHKVSRAFGVIAAVAVGLAMVGIMVTQFFLANDKGASKVWTIIRVLYVLAILSTVGTAAIIYDCIDAVSDVNDFTDDNLCELGTAGYLNSANFWILLGVSITSCCTPAPSEPLFNICSASTDTKPTAHGDVEAPEGPRTSTYGASSVTRTIKNTPEGRKIVEETTNPNGTKTVTETFEAF